MTNLNQHEDDNPNCGCLKCENRRVKPNSIECASTSASHELYEEDICVNLVEKLADFEYLSNGFPINVNEADIAFETWDKVLLKMKPGDLVEFDRGFYRHWAIFESGSTIIHVRAHDGEDFEKTVKNFAKLEKDRSIISNDINLTPVSMRSKIATNIGRILPNNLFALPSQLLAGSLTTSLGPKPGFVTTENNRDISFGRQPPTLRDALIGTMAWLARDSLSLIAGKSLIRVNNKEFEAKIKGVFPPKSSETALKAAKTMLHKDVPYHILTNNCEHYVTRWKYGEPGWSSQTREAAIKIYAATQSFCSHRSQGHSVLPSLMKAYYKFKETQKNI